MSSFPDAFYAEVARVGIPSKGNYPFAVEDRRVDSAALDRVASQ